LRCTSSQLQSFSENFRRVPVEETPQIERLREKFQIYTLEAQAQRKHQHLSFSLHYSSISALFAPNDQNRPKLRRLLHRDPKLQVWQPPLPNGHRPERRRSQTNLLSGHSRSQIPPLLLENLPRTLESEWSCSENHLKRATSSPKT
jgi:hypothetical protein